jgi:preprotein translocase subunit YajC
MLISPAFAETVASTTAPDGNIFTSLLPILLILAVFFFLVIRPQNKRVQEHRNMVNALQKGDKVVTGGGLIATVKKVVSDDEVLLELAEGVEVLAVRSTIMTVRPKTNGKKE